MESCNRSQLCAYLDGELSADARRRIDAHLQDCPTCVHELEELRNVVNFVDRYDYPDVLPVELKRAHELIERGSPASLWRIGRAIAAVAASIAIIAGAWLAELPAPAPAPRPAMAASTPPAWEQVALTLRVETEFSDTQPPVRLADAAFTHWMVDSLLERSK